MVSLPTFLTRRAEPSMFDEHSVALFGASCRAAAQSAKRAGASKIHAWDDFLDADLAHVATVAPLSDWEQDQAGTWIDLHDCSVVLCGGMENKPQLVDQLIRLGARCGTTGDALRELRSCTNWKRWAEASSIAWPPTYGPFDSASSELNTLRNRLDRKRLWLLKPANGAGGIHVRPLADETSFEPTNVIQSQAALWYVQQYIPGKSIGVSYCSDRLGTHVVGIARGIDPLELEAPLPFVYRGNVASISVEKQVRDSIQVFGQQVAKQTGLLGLWQADFQLDSDGRLWLLEINPRWSASMELHETLQGFSWMRKHLEILRSPSEFIADDSDRCTVSDGQIAKWIVYAPRDMNLSDDQIGRLWESRWDGTLSELEVGPFRMADIPESMPGGLSIPQGMPIATVLCWSGQFNDSEAALLGKIQHARSVVLDWLK
jgi:predicted ATP-grasp superfamily ATP-dependent carboligase